MKTLEKYNLICTYDETKESIDNLIIKVFENFVENELEVIYHV
ncbi:MAG: hypothetical protein RSE41_04285 [Clostridia bacterium]